MQVVQSRCYEAATAYWRRIKTDPDAETMGVLYWQLNDIWQARTSLQQHRYDFWTSCLCTGSCVGPYHIARMKRFVQSKHCRP